MMSKSFSNSPVDLSRSSPEPLLRDKNDLLSRPVNPPSSMRELEEMLAPTIKAMIAEDELRELNDVCDKFA